MNDTNQKNYNKVFLKNELTRAFQATKNSPPTADKIHNEMLKHLPPERLDFLLVLYNNIWQQEYFPKNMVKVHSNTNIKTRLRPKELNEDCYSSICFEVCMPVFK